MTPSATAAMRHLIGAALAGVVLVPTGAILAAPAYADDAASPVSATPTVSIGEPAYAELPTPAASEWPDSGGWIIGGTLQEGTVAGPKTAPVKAPVKAPAAQPARPAPAAPVARSVTVTGPVPQDTTAGSEAMPTALPFTGPGRLTVQLTLGGGLVLLGGAMTIVAGRKGTFAPSR